MASGPPKIHIDSVERMTIGNGEKFAASIGRIGAQLGMAKISRSKTNGIMGVSADIVDVKISDRHLGVYTSNL